MKEKYLHRLNMLKLSMELDIENELLCRRIGPKLGKQGQELIKIARITRITTIEIFKQQQANFQSWLAKQSDVENEL